MSPAQELSVAVREVYGVHLRRLFVLAFFISLMLILGDVTEPAYAFAVAASPLAVAMLWCLAMAYARFVIYLVTGESCDEFIGRTLNRGMRHGALDGVAREHYGTHFGQPVPLGDGCSCAARPISAESEKAAGGSAADSEHV